MLVLFVWLIGVAINEKHLGKRLKSLFKPLVLKVPLLSTLFKITHQVTNTLQNSNSFRETVLVRFPTNYTYSVGFITSEHPKTIEKVLGKSDLVSVFIPTTPNPTNGYLVVVDKKHLIHTDIPVSTAISFIISMGTAGATQEILKSSQISEWDFFLNTFAMFCAFIMFKFIDFIYFCRDYELSEKKSNEIF